MANHDYVIDNQTAPNFRADLNNALQAIVSTNSSTSAPSTTYANMMWYDTTNNLLRMRNEADDAWITLGTLDQVANTFAASVLIASQAEAEAGTENTKTMTPLRVEQAISQRAVGGAINSVSRSFATTYQNTRSRDIIVMPVLSSTANAVISLEISTNGSSWVPAFQQTVSTPNQIGYALVVPVGFYYRATTSAGTGVVNAWREIY